MNPTELRQQRAKLVADARAIHAKARAENRELNAEERQEDDRLWSAGEALKVQYEGIEASAQRTQRWDDAATQLATSQGRVTAPAQPSQSGSVVAAADSPQPYAFKFRGRPVTYQAGSNAWHRHQPDFRAAFNSWIGHGAQINPTQFAAALRTDVDTQGGYLTVPEEFVAELIKEVDDMVWIRQLARTFTTTAQSLGAPKRTAKMACFAWGSELSDAELTADSTLAFGKRTLTPHYMTGSILISRDLLRAAISGLEPEAMVRAEMARDSGELEENAFMTGSGANRPLGLFTATADGISTARDVSTGNTTGAIGADNLREVKYSLKEQYRRDATIRWLLSRTAIKGISKLKDGEGQYLWQQGIAAGDPDRILAIPIVESEFVPSTFTTGLYVGMLGAFRNYWIVDALQLDMQRLVETYAKTNQIQFIARRKVDGMPVLEEAFVRMKLA